MTHEETRRNPGFAAGIAKRTTGERLHWTLKAAPMRKKDLKLSALEAVAAGRKLRNDISAKMVRAELSPEDAIVSIVFAKPDLSAFNPRLLNIEVTANGHDLNLAQEFAGELAIGFLVFVWDRKGETAPIYGHVRPLIVEDPRAWELNAAALRARELKLRNSLKADGVTLPDEVKDWKNRNFRA
jgi:hypothetical protein